MEPEKQQKLVLKMYRYHATKQSVNTAAIAI